MSPRSLVAAVHPPVHAPVPMPVPAPVPAPYAPTLHPSWLPVRSTELWIAFAVAFALVLAFWLWRSLRANRQARAALPPPAPPPAAPQLPPSAEELAHQAQQEEARQRAEALSRERRQLESRLAGTTGPAERAGLQEQLAALKGREEAAKKEAYRAGKLTEREARDRKEREAEARARQEEEERRAEQERREAEARARAEEEKRRIEAEAGRTLAGGLERTRSQGFIAKLNGLFSTERALDEGVLAELEEILFTADIGVKTASRLVELAREKLKAKDLTSAQKIKALIRSEVEKILDLPRPRSLQGGGPPHVTMVVGVNGAGKTTTIGKLAAKLTSQGKKVVLAAGDTFRAAATEQLDVWAERAHAELVKGADGADPGAVVFDAIKRAQQAGVDVVIADTAGRLHTKAPLMEELKKVRRVMDKALPGAPHEVLLVLDATNGQNAIAQAKQFQEAVQVTGIALTKLDGTAKGGVIIGICDELKIPVLWAGVGEKVQDLRSFEPKEFVAALFD